MGRIKSIYNLLMDTVEDTLVHIDYIHHEIHEGKFHTAIVKFESLGDAGIGDLYFKAPDTTVRCHVFGYFATEGLAEFAVRRSATITASGSQITSYNNDHNSALSATAIVRSSPTITASGTLVGLTQAGGGKGSGVYGGSAGSRIEFIAKQGTIYIFRITSRAATNDGTITLEWYEA